MLYFTSFPYRIKITMIKFSHAVSLKSGIYFHYISFSLEQTKSSKIRKIIIILVTVFRKSSFLWKPCNILFPSEITE